MMNGPSTPLPWSVDKPGCVNKVCDCWLLAEATRYQAEKNAAYIVEACNAYPRLIEEREKLIEALSNLSLANKQAALEGRGLQEYEEWTQALVVLASLEKDNG